MAKTKKKTSVPGKLIASNKKAYHEYFIEDTIEAGIVLLGPEVKSLRAGRVNLRDGYARITNGEVFLCNVHISPYEFTNNSIPEPMRIRKLLLNAREIKKLIGKVQEKGVALIPLKIYFKANGRAKLALGLAKGKKMYDKRASIKERESNRELARLNKGNRYNNIDL